MEMEEVLKWGNLHCSEEMRGVAPVPRGPCWRDSPAPEELAGQVPVGGWRLGRGINEI